MFTFLLLLSLLNEEFAYRSFINSDFETSYALTCKDSFSRSPRYHYIACLSSYYLGKQKEANFHADWLLVRDEQSIPVRYSYMAQMVKLEKHLSQYGDIGKVADLLKNATRRLEQAKGGEITQKLQKDAIDLLDKQIKQLERELENSQSGAGVAGSNHNSPSPAQDSVRTPPTGEERGTVDLKKFIKDNKIWGALPPKERIKAMEAISRDYPPHMREAIEGYLRGLANGIKQ